MSQTTRLTDVEWVEETTRCLMALAPDLAEPHAREFVDALAERERWRQLAPPEAAARAANDG